MDRLRGREGMCNKFGEVVVGYRWGSEMVGWFCFGWFGGLGGLGG